MAGKDVAAISANFAADGTSEGVVQLASTTGFWASAVVFLSSATVDPVKARIVKVIDATHLAVRLEPGDLDDAVRLKPAVYGRSDLSAFHLADTAQIFQDKQFIYNAT